MNRTDKVLSLCVATSSLEIGIDIGNLEAIIKLGDPEVTANICCKSRNLPNTDTQNYSTDLRHGCHH